MTTHPAKNPQVTAELPARCNITLIIPPRNQQLREAAQHRLTTEFKHCPLMIKPVTLRIETKENQ